jgi:hypothetical protein
VPPAIPVSVAYRFPSLSKDKVFPRGGDHASRGCRWRAGTHLDRSEDLSVRIECDYLWSSTLGSLISVPSASANGAHASIRKTVPLGNFLVERRLCVGQSLLEDGLEVFFDQNRGDEEEKVPWETWMGGQNIRGRPRAYGLHRAVSEKDSPRGRGRCRTGSVLGRQESSSPCFTV